MHPVALPVQVFDKGLALQQVAKPRQVDDNGAACTVLWAALGAARLCLFPRRARGVHGSAVLRQRGVFAAVQHVQGKGFFLLEAVGHSCLNVAVRRAKLAHADVVHIVDEVAFVSRV